MAIKLTAATDGACSGNPGPGGWGYVLVDANGNDIRVDSGGEPDTTNQRMELQAAIAALEGAPPEAPLVILSDSRYVVQGATAWIHNWRRRGWRTAGGKAVANRELWERLGAAQAIRTARTSFEWVKGHAGHPLNVRADAAARDALRRSEAVRRQQAARHHS